MIAVRNEQHNEGKRQEQRRGDGDEGMAKTISHGSYKPKKCTVRSCESLLCRAREPCHYILEHLAEEGPDTPKK